MKQIIALLLLIGLMPFSSFSQEKSARYLEILALLKSEGYEISTEQYANLAQGETAEHVKTFYTGLEYVIVACSDDDDVSDVDVYLQEADGTEYSKDTDNSNIAVVKFEPYATRDMKVVIKNYTSSTPSYESRCRLVIAYK